MAMIMGTDIGTDTDITMVMKHDVVDIGQEVDTEMRRDMSAMRDREVGEEEGIENFQIQ